MIQAGVSLLPKRGIIRKSFSAWAAPCVVVPKKDGTLRVCQDYRALNNLLVTDSAGLGDIRGIFDGLNGQRFFTSIDLASGFFQHEIEDTDKHKTAFRDAYGSLWEYNRCSFELKTLPAAFANRVALTLSELKGKGVENWLDDIPIYSKTFDEHATRLGSVLSKLQENGFSVNFVKSKWCCSSQEFVGVAVDLHGVWPADIKIAAIERLASPRTVEKLRTFLGMTGYLRQFVERYSGVAAPLTDILRNKRFASKRAQKLPIPWTADHETAFQALKAAILSPRVLAFPAWDRPFAFHTNASMLGAGAALTQEHNSAERVIAFASHRWSLTDSRQSAIEREGMAVLWAVAHFRPYLVGRPFTLVADCSALTWLFRSRDLSPKLHQWVVRLMEFDMALQWRAGASHQLADALSRLHASTQAATDVDASFPDNASSTEHGVYLGPLGPILDGVLLSELEVQPVVGRPLGLAAFVNRAEYPVLFDSVPMNFVKFGDLGSDLKVTKDRISQHVTEMSTASSTLPSDDMREPRSRRSASHQRQLGRFAAL